MITFFKARNATISGVFVKGKWKRSIKPKLTLTGDWLQEAGFDIGTKVQVEVVANKMIIKRLSDDVQG